MAEKFSRRKFLKLTATTGGALVLSHFPGLNVFASPEQQSPPELDLANLRNLILTIDETSVAWPDVSKQWDRVPLSDAPGLDGAITPHRAMLAINTGTQDMTFVRGGQFDFVGNVEFVEGVEYEGQQASQQWLEAHFLPGYESVTLKDSNGYQIVIVKRDRIIIPGRSKDPNIQRTNLVYFIGEATGNTVTNIEVDTASNFVERRLTGVANTEPVSTDGVNWLAAYAKSHVKSAIDQSHGDGCDVVGVYVIRGGHDASRPPRLLFGAVYTAQEIQWMPNGPDIINKTSTSSPSPKDTLTPTRTATLTPTSLPVPPATATTVATETPIPTVQPIDTNTQNLAQLCANVHGDLKVTDQGIACTTPGKPTVVIDFDSFMRAASEAVKDPVNLIYPIAASYFGIMGAGLALVVRKIIKNRRKR